MKRYLFVYLFGFAFIFLMSFLVVDADLMANPWLKTTQVNLKDLHLWSRPALLYYYLPTKFRLQTLLFSAIGPLWVILVLYAKKSGGNNPA